MDYLERSVDLLPHTAAMTIRKFKNIGLKTYFDLINYFPYRYDVYKIPDSFSHLEEGAPIQVQGLVHSFKNTYTRAHLTIQKLVLQTDKGKMDVVFYNQPFLSRVISTDQNIAISGRVKKFLNTISLQADEYEILKGDAVPSGTIIPIYSAKNGLSTKIIRDKIHMILTSSEWDIHEILPAKIISEQKLISEKEAYEHIHFPKTEIKQKAAEKRLSFDELFTIQVSCEVIKKDWEKDKVGNQFVITEQQKRKLQELIESLPYKLTDDQQKSLDEILHDFNSSRPMNRLLQGDVGSGKTIVAALAAYVTYLQGYKTLIMAPTEILALQHYKSITSVFSKVKGIEIPRIAVFTSSTKTENTEKYDIIIGTHALIAKSATFPKVGFVVVDEQHKFGVAQRAQLKSQGFNPHLLTMTATPIPRTVLLTLYKELDTSLLQEKPKGRIEIKTFVTPQNKRKDGYEWIRTQIQKDHIQVYIVCPLIDISEEESMKEIKAVKEEYESIKKIFSEYRIGLLHGKLKAKEKNEVLDLFAKGEYDILVSTPVVEVGIDVANATIIIIETPERFGLAQLHQLRGRVGRGDKQSYCVLFPADDSNVYRLRKFASTTSGFELAEYDLRIRGAGDMYGTRQHGASTLKIASLSDAPLIKASSDAVTQFIDEYDIQDYPHLKKRLEDYKISLITKD